MSFISSFHYAYAACFLDMMPAGAAIYFLRADILYDILFGIEILTNFFTEKHYSAS